MIGGERCQEEMEQAPQAPAREREEVWAEVAAEAVEWAVTAPAPAPVDTASARIAEQKFRTRPESRVFSSNALNAGRKW